MKIVVDYRLAARSSRGMARYCREIVYKLMTLDHTNNYILYVDTTEKFDLSLPANFTIRQIKHCNYIIGEQWLIPRLLRIDNPDIYWAPYNTFPLILPQKTVLVVTIHDLIFLKNIKGPINIKQRIGKIYRALVIRFGLSRINHVVSVSKYSADEIKKTLHIQDVTITYNCVDSFIEKAKHRESTITPPYKSYFFTLSGDAPSKNLPFVINLFKQNLPDETLVIAGIQTDSPIRKDATEQIIFLPSGISDEELIAYYSNCKAFIFLSKYEGFGIPILEALSCNARVIASNTTSIPEVVGNCGILVDPNNCNQCIEAIKNIDTYTIDSNEIKRQIALFSSWDTPAATLLNLFQHIEHNIQL